MGRQTAQGTRHETHIKRRFESYGLSARRTAKSGIRDEPDVIVDGAEMIPIVAYKHYIPTGQRRKTLSLIIMHEDDFFNMFDESRPWPGFYVQVKATQRLSVPKVYQGLRDWVREHA